MTEERSLIQEIATLKAYVAELEQALEGALWSTKTERFKLECTLGLSPQQAHTVLLLYKAKRPLQNRELSDSIPASHGKERAGSYSNYASVVLYAASQKCGVKMNTGVPYHGSVLTPEGRKLVERALAS